MPIIASAMARGTVPRGVAHLAARHQRRLDAGEREDQQQGCAGDIGGRRRTVTVQVLGSHEEQPADRDEQQRQ